MSEVEYMFLGEIREHLLGVPTEEGGELLLPPTMKLQVHIFHMG